MGEYYRSKSHGDGRNEMENTYLENGNKWEKPTNFGATNNSVSFQDIRCHSASHVSSTITTPQILKELKKGKTGNPTSSARAGWCFSDPEMQRKKRVASYKSYSVETKIKRSFSRSFRWLKDRYSRMLHGC